MASLVGSYALPNGVESLISVVQSARIMEIIFRLETKWEDNYDIIVPILAICTIIASNRIVSPAP